MEIDGNMFLINDKKILRKLNKLIRNKEFYSDTNELECYPYCIYKSDDEYRLIEYNVNTCKYTNIGFDNLKELIMYIAYTFKDNEIINGIKDEINDVYRLHRVNTLILLIILIFLTVVDILLVFYLMY